MKKYTVTYASTEYYVKTYEAESEEDALAMYYDDDRKWDSGPDDMDTEVINVVEGGE